MAKKKKGPRKQKEPKLVQPGDQLTPVISEAVLIREQQAASDYDFDKVTGLNHRQELFCQLFASDREFFGNGVQSYIEAYDIDTSRKGAYESAGVSAHDLLKLPKITTRINQLLESAVLNDSFVDKQLAFVISQNAEFPSKVAAIKEYNKLKQRIVDRQKIEVEERFAVDDIRAILSVLPQERQDEIYAVIAAGIAEAELLRSSPAGAGSDTK